MSHTSSLTGLAFDLEEHSVIWRWAAHHEWIAPIIWDHENYEEIAGVSVNWNGLTDFSIWKCARTGDAVAVDWLGLELARGELEHVLNVVAKVAARA